MFFGSNCLAEDHYFIESDRYPAVAADKFSGGMVNIVSAALEIPKNIINTTNEANLFLGLSGGLLKGILNTGGRLGAGLIDVVTFYVPTKPVAKPNFIWQNFDAATSYNDAFRLRK